VARPITAKDRKDVKRLHGKGMSRNDIARAIGRSPSTVSKLANEQGLTFDRAPQVEAATAVRKADLAARRTVMAERLHDAAERELSKLTAPTLYWDWGGKDHEFDTYEAAEPTAADRRAIMGIINTALDRSAKLVPPRDDAGAESRSVIGDLIAGLAADYAARHGGPPPEPEEPEAAADDAP
jgi:hypothetical protein